MNLADTRSVYSTLSSRASLLATLTASGVSYPVEIATDDFGTLSFTACSLAALNLDGLFSARFDGATVQETVLSALRAAADAALYAEDDLCFVVRFGRAGFARLRARAFDGWVMVMADGD